jgi:hypothetical protein
VDLELARRETERAFAEAGVSDYDLSYLTSESIELGLREARDVTELPPEEQGESQDVAAATNYLSNVWFTGGPGSLVYGYLTNPTNHRLCSKNYYVRMTYYTRSVWGSCTTGGTVWKVT